MNRVGRMFWRIVIIFIVLITPVRTFAQEVVEVRNGEHSTFSRLVFDWQEIVNYSQKLTDDKIEVTFDKASIPNWNTLINEPLKYLAEPEYRIDGGKLIVTVKVPKSSQLNHFRYNTKIIFDVTGKGEVIVNTVGEPVVAQPIPVVDTGTIEEIIPDQKKNTVSDNGILKMDVDRKWNNIRLSFPWSENVKTAAFIRHNFLWLVFDGKKTVDQSELESFLGQRILSARQLDHPAMTVLMYELVPDLNVTAQRVDAVWHIDLKTPHFAPTLSVLTSYQRAAGNRGNNFFFSVENAGSVLVVTDPVIGDTLVIVPILGSSQGVLQKQKFTEFESLATAQGIAVQLIADNVNVVKYTNGVSVTAKEGLALSRNRLSSRLGMVAGSDKAGGENDRLVDFAAWEKGPLTRKGQEEDYHANKHELLYMLSNSTDATRSEMRWDLARFYLANGRIREGFGVMSVMQDEDPELINTPEFRVVLGIANILMRRFREGANLLSHKSLVAEKGVLLWRAVAENALGNHKVALENYKKASDKLSLHDLDSQIRFLFAAINSANEVGDKNFVYFSLSFLRKLPLNVPQLMEVDYWEASLERDRGNLLQAGEILQGIVKAGVRQTAAWAKSDLIDMEFKSEKIDATEAVDKLEKLRFSWRGDDFELELLSRLGEIYVAQNEFNKGLQTLKLAVTFFEGSKKTAELTRQMNKIYSDLFLSGGADVLSPVKAVALYSEFRELIPLGKDGDTMTRRLADRLVLLDLLEEAAELLNHQIKFRLKGGAQSIVASRLAMIYLLDSKPEKALEILRATRNSQTPDDIRDRRRMIEARALIELDSYEEAEVLIEAYNTMEVQNMRSDIYWRSENWAKYIGHKNRMLGNRYQDDNGLSPEERLSVLRLSVAYVISGDKSGVRTLRNRYKGHMDNGLYGDTFEVITAERQLTDLNVGRLTRSIASVNKLETFMQSYKAEFSNKEVAQN